MFFRCAGGNVGRNEVKHFFSMAKQLHAYSHRNRPEPVTGRRGKDVSAERTSAIGEYARERTIRSEGDP